MDEYDPEQLDDIPDIPEFHETDMAPEVLFGINMVGRAMKVAHGEEYPTSEEFIGMGDNQCSIEYAKLSMFLGKIARKYGIDSQKTTQYFVDGYDSGL